MLPIYSITLKRNEYFVLWRNTCFGTVNEYTKWLNKEKNYIKTTIGINVYFKFTTEDALILLRRKKYNKVILISNIGRDLGGIKFIEKARKIIGCNVVVLYFTGGIYHLNLVKKSQMLYILDFQIHIKNIFKILMRMD